jgi:hypothetical protein
MRDISWCVMSIFGIGSIASSAQVSVTLETDWGASVANGCEPGWPLSRVAVRFLIFCSYDRNHMENLRNNTGLMKRNAIYSKQCRNRKNAEQSPRFFVPFERTCVLLDWMLAYPNRHERREAGGKGCIYISGHG